MIGGGYFGCTLAVHLRLLGRSVVLVEREDDILQRASRHNQARIHRGYHYPRSLRTGLRSSANYERFVSDHADAVDERVTSIYAIARRNSRVSASQFRLFCERIGAPIQPPDPAIEALFDPGLVEAVFTVQEAVFDSTTIAGRLRSQMATLGVQVHLGEEVDRIEPSRHGLLVNTTTPDRLAKHLATEVYVCAYAATNALLDRCGLRPIPLRRQETELVLVRLLPALAGVGITVMDGPFFSVLPFPGRSGTHSLTHVRFTPRQRSGEWVSAESDRPPGSAFTYMVHDAMRYVPSLGMAEYVASVRETKVFPAFDGDNDGRPIVIHRPAEMPGLTFIVGGKIDNAYDMLDDLRLTAVASS